MGLIGRLEDLPITDILQIVFLSRGTGVLELRLDDGRHTVMFGRGLVVNATSPSMPTLQLDLEKRLDLGPVKAVAQQKEIPIGQAAIEMNLIAPADLEKIVTERVLAIIRALRSAANGEFEFMAREPTLAEIEYEPRMVFRRGGIHPEQIVGKEPVRLRTLGTVKASLSAGAQRTLPPHPEPAVEAAPETAPKPPERPLFLLHDDPVIRTAAQRLSGKNLALIQPALSEARNHLDALLDGDQFFVAVLDLDLPEPASSVLPLVRHIKRRNPRLPVAVIDRAADFRRRHLSYEAGADLYLRKPGTDAEEEISLFIDDVMLFVDRRFAENIPSGGTAAGNGPIHRGFRLLVELIKEVSGPNDISQVSLTILQLAADYVDRGVLFAIKGQELVTLGKFGLRNGNGGARLQRGEISILDQVVTTGKPYRGQVDAAAAAQLTANFGGAKVGEVVALPMLNDRMVVGVLYGDNAIHKRPIEDILGLEAFLSQAGFAFQNALLPKTPLPGKLPGGELQFL